ncbi:MAG: virulence RhuM family protein, partial [Planctomycetaceae bacterium]
MTETLPGPAPDDSGEFILYQTEDGQTRIDVRMADETVWLSQKAMADLFQVTVPNVSQHLKSIYKEGELRLAATVKQYLIVQTEGRRQVSRSVDHYNLDAILAVGYRVRSHRGTQFRIWATERLREYLIKG